MFSILQLVFAGNMNGGRGVTLQMALLVAVSIKTAKSGIQLAHIWEGGS